MTTRISLAAVAVATVLLAAGCKDPEPGATSLRKQPIAPASGTATGEEHLVAGVLAAARPDQLTVRKPDGQQLTLRMNDDTDVLIDGSKGLRDALPEGAHVEAAYQGSGDAPLAIRVAARSPGHPEQAPGSSTR